MSWVLIYIATNFLAPIPRISPRIIDFLSDFPPKSMNFSSRISRKSASRKKLARKLAKAGHRLRPDHRPAKAGPLPAGQRRTWPSSIPLLLATRPIARARLHRAALPTHPSCSLHRIASQRPRSAPHRPCSTAPFPPAHSATEPPVSASVQRAHQLTAPLRPCLTSGTQHARAAPSHLHPISLPPRTPASDAAHAPRSPPQPTAQALATAGPPHGRPHSARSSTTRQHPPLVHSRLPRLIHHAPQKTGNSRP
jgi:hypothetical protein